jgi:hypothetical protein
MSELARRILRKSITAMRSDCIHCSECHRVPVPGEFVHRLASEEIVCSLCLARLPEAKRAGAAAERIHASDQHLRVAPRAA